MTCFSRPQHLHMWLFCLFKPETHFHKSHQELRMLFLFRSRNLPCMPSFLMSLLGLVQEHAGIDNTSLTPNIWQQSYLHLQSIEMQLFRVRDITFKICHVLTCSGTLQYMLGYTGNITGLLEEGHFEYNSNTQIRSGKK